jgi:hypothetical protein
MPDNMKLHGMMVTEDGGKTWIVTIFFSRASAYYGESKGCLKASSFPNMTLVQRDE